MKVIDRAALDDLAAAAAAAPRRRSHRNLHDDLADPIQRLLMALETDTYVRPHRHPDKFELFLLLSGRCTLLTFDDAGAVIARIDLAEAGTRLVECPPGTWHTVLAEQSGSVVVEVKPGPYRPTAPEDFAGWAPAEGAPEVADYLDRLRRGP